MNVILKFLVVFFIYGLAWFVVFSIPVGKKPVFIVLQDWINTGSDAEKQRTQKDINKKSVIDALSKAFEK